ncbi:hypothetical protein MG5_03968 [Candida albicans P57072]|nr:hypothetical protein MG1_03965 [Candida albicans GC75]KGR06169.1 hypothetical protein MG5_03968 [Candida albicans P57072]KHC49261.1 hypothetical protein MEW_03879 [Candida albicans P60002]
MSYKHIQRQFRRLPLPPPIVIDGSRVLKRDYKAGKSAVADLLALPHSQSIPKLLDYIYKYQPAWWNKFMKCSYYNLKDKWPIVHLIDELKVDTKDYHNHQQFSLVEGTPTRPTLPLIKSYANQKDTTTAMIKEVEKLYKFILSKRGLFNVTNHPMEVIYTPSKLGKMHHQVVLDKELRDKVKLIKRVFREVQPIDKKTLDKLRAIDSPSPILKQYLARQFYLEDGNYILNIE